MPPSGDNKAPDEFILMRQIYDGLQYLDYEVDFNPIERHFPYLNELYFAIPGQSQKEQFDYFAALCVWMMQKFLGSTIETPSEYDQPTAVADSLIVNLPSVGFKLSISSSKLIPGCGLPVCTILNAVVHRTLKTRNFQPHPLRCFTKSDGESDVNQVDADEDSDGLIDDAADIAPDDEGESVIEEAMPLEVENPVDSLELKREAERVAPQLQIVIKSNKADWRTHFYQMNQRQTEITELMNGLAPILNAVGTEVSKAISLIENREKSLNNRFQTSVADYASRASALASVEAKHKARTAEVAALQDELDSTLQKLDMTKKKLDEKTREMSDNSPLMKIKSSITQIKEEIKQLEIRSSILQRTLTQGLLEQKEKAM